MPFSADLKTIYAAGKSDTNKLGSVILMAVDRHGEADVRAVGPLAVSQSVKALAVARRMASQDGRDLAGFPEFTTANVGGKEVVAIKLIVEEVQ